MPEMADGLVGTERYERTTERKGVSNREGLPRCETGLILDATRLMYAR